MGMNRDDLKSRHERMMRALSDEQVTDRYVRETLKLKTLTRWMRAERPEERPVGYPNTLMINLCKRGLARRNLTIPVINLPEETNS